MGEELTREQLEQWEQLLEKTVGPSIALSRRAAQSLVAAARSTLLTRERLRLAEAVCEAARRREAAIARWHKINRQAPDGAAPGVDPAESAEAWSAVVAADREIGQALAAYTRSLAAGAST